MSKPNHLLSQMYKLVLSGHNISTPYFIKVWERELSYTFTSLQVKKLMESMYSSSIQEMSYKFVARWYLTPARFAQIYMTADECCWRGCKQKGTFLQIWWSCPKIRPFWDEIAPWIKKMTIKHIELSPLHFLFHGIPASIKFYKKKVLHHIC